MSTIRDTGLVQTNDYANDHGEVRVLDPDGHPLSNAEMPDLSDDELLELYEHLVLARRFDERALSFQRQGRLATYAPMTGQEGAQIAATMALNDEDWVFPTYREHAVRMIAGLDLESVLLPLMGVRQSTAERTAPTLLPEAIPIATQIPHATGSAMAMDYRDDEAVTLAHFGDGATSEGDFHEGLNIAGVFDAPTIFFCHNNQWAISTPRRRQTASATLAQKAEAYGFEGVRVDGLDPLAVYSATKYAREKALDPDSDELRPTLIESVEYRFGAHTTSDDPSTYRNEEEVEYWRRRDPLERMETFLRERGLLDDEQQQAIEAVADERVADAMAAAEEYQPDPERLFDDVYAEATPQMQEQLAELQAMRERHGDDHYRPE